MNNYKYLKYKKKYLDLKKLLGGSDYKPQLTNCKSRNTHTNIDKLINDLIDDDDIFNKKYNNFIIENCKTKGRKQSIIKRISNKIGEMYSNDDYLFDQILNKYTFNIIRRNPNIAKKQKKSILMKLVYLIKFYMI